MLPLSDEILQQIGIREGENLALSVENEKLVVRSLSRVELENRVDEIVAGLLEKRQSAYERLAEGA